MNSKPEYIRLSELISEKPRNGLYKGKEYQGKGHRWVKMNQIYGNDFFLDQETELLSVTESEIDRFNCKAGDLLFGRTSLVLEGIGDCLLVGEVKDVPIFESNLFRIRFNTNRAYPLFYYYFFKSNKGRLLIQTIAKQTAATSITASDLISLPVPFFSVEIQKKIADQIALFDNKIELNRQTNQTLEHIAQAIFKSWFVDFEPTRAKIKAKKHWQAAQQNIKASSPSDYAEPSDKQHQHTTSLQEAMNRAAMAAISGKTEAELNNLPADTLQQLRTTAELFPDSLVESELGEIPAGWGISCIDDVCDFQNGYAFKSKEMSKKPDDAYRVFKMGGIKKGGGLNRASTRDWYEKSKCEKLDRYLIKKGDLLMCMTDMKNNVALLGHTALMDVGDEYILNQRVGLLRTKNKNIANYPFLYILTNNEAFIEGLRSRANSGVQVNLSTKEIKETKFILPSKDIHMEFDKLTEQLQEQKFSLEAEQDHLSELRDTLLPKLLSGELSATV